MNTTQQNPKLWELSQDIIELEDLMLSYFFGKNRRESVLIVNLNR
jgi:hypothetical protein